MTIAEKMQHIESALEKLGDAETVTVQLTPEEYTVIRDALTFISGVYHGYRDFFGEQSNGTA